jgi:hypothetical protein
LAHAGVVLAVEPGLRHEHREHAENDGDGDHHNRTSTHCYYSRCSLYRVRSGVADKRCGEVLKYASNREFSIHVERAMKFHAFQLLDRTRKSLAAGFGW